MNIKPNFSELAREYDLDRRTVKKYYEGYEGKSKTRNKSSRLDQYYIEIKEIPSFAFCAKTIEKARENYKKQLKLSLQVMLEMGEHITEPGEDPEDTDW